MGLSYDLCESFNTFSCGVVSLKALECVVDNFCEFLIAMEPASLADDFLWRGERNKGEVMVIKIFLQEPLAHRPFIVGTGDKR